MYIKIKCLECGRIFKRKVNGKVLRYYAKDESITDNKGNRQNCPKCGCTRVKFNDHL